MSQQNLSLFFVSRKLFVACKIYSSDILVILESYIYLSFAVNLFYVSQSNFIMVGRHRKTFFLNFTNSLNINLLSLSFKLMKYKTFAIL